MLALGFVKRLMRTGMHTGTSEVDIVCWWGYISLADECAGGNMIPTQEEVVAQFTYLDGGLYRYSTGKRGHRRPDGYVYTRIMGSAFGEHRLVHLMFSGEWPEQVDHINGIRYDNRPENLRSATHAQNCMNRKPTGRSSKGCYWQPKRRKWIAQIGFKGKRITIGYYDTEHEAACAYAEKSLDLHKEFSRTE